MSIRDARVETIRRVLRPFADEPKCMANGRWRAYLEASPNTRRLKRALHIINR